MAKIRTVEADVKKHTKVKSYPNGLHRVTSSSCAIFTTEGWEPAAYKESYSKPQNPESEARFDSTRRAKEKCFDIAMMNEFNWFITWTLSKTKIDRYSPEEVAKKLKKFLNNMSQRYGLRYLIIPEYHRDGAIHMHGLVSGDMKVVDSGKKTLSGKPIYNMPQWKYGYSTAIGTYGDQEAVCKYITKYVTKDFKMIFGNFTMPGDKV